MPLHPPQPHELPGPGSCKTPAGAQPDPLYAGTMFRKKKKKRPEISAPQNFQHRVHTSFDPKEGKFVGLPPQWQNILDTLRRPKPVVDPSRITRVQLQPMKVRWAAGMAWPSSASCTSWCLAKPKRRLEKPPNRQLSISCCFHSLLISLSLLPG